MAAIKMRKIIHIVFLDFYDLAKTLFPFFLFLYFGLFVVFLLRVSQTIFLSSDRWLLAVVIWLVLSVFFILVYGVSIAIVSVYRIVIK